METARSAVTALAQYLLVMGLSVAAAGWLTNWRYGHGLGDRAHSICVSMQRTGLIVALAAALALGVSWALSLA